MMNKYHKYAIEQIKSRAAAVLLNGPSIEELENHIEKLGNKNILYYCLNNRFTIEKNILSKIGKKTDVWCLFYPRDAIRYWKEIYDFLEDETSLLLITCSNTLLELQHLISHKPLPNAHKIFISDSINCSVENRNPKGSLNTLFLLLSIILYIGAKESIFLFGCDGTASPKTSSDIFYKKDDTERDDAHKQQIFNDCVAFNRLWKKNLQYIAKELGDLPTILNVNTQSYYNAFTKVTYKKAFALLSELLPACNKTTQFVYSQKENFDIHNNIMKQTDIYCINKSINTLTEKMYTLSMNTTHAEVPLAKQKVSLSTLISNKIRSKL